jgi:hypothetical protein
MNEPKLNEQEKAPTPVACSALLGGIKELGDGWRLEYGLANKCSRIVRPDGVTALYRYQETTEDDALLIKWAYQNGYEHGDSERGHKIKTILGLNASGLRGALRDQMTSNREAELPAIPRIDSGDWLGGSA